MRTGTSVGRSFRFVSSRLEGKRGLSRTRDVAALTIAYWHEYTNMRRHYDESEGRRPGQQSLYGDLRGVAGMSGGWLAREREGRARSSVRAKGE